MDIIWMALDKLLLFPRFPNKGYRHPSVTTF